jgi:hypothetical protein
MPGYKILPVVKKVILCQGKYFVYEVGQWILFFLCHELSQWELSSRPVTFIKNNVIYQ